MLFSVNEIIKDELMILLDNENKQSINVRIIKYHIWIPTLLATVESFFIEYSLCKFGSYKYFKDPSLNIIKIIAISVLMFSRELSL